MEEFWLSFLGTDPRTYTGNPSLEMAGNAIPIPGSPPWLRSLVLFKSCDLSPRIDIPNNHTAAAFTNAVQVPLAANWTKFGMLALILSYVSVGQSNAQDKIPTALSQPCLQMKLNSLSFSRQRSKTRSSWGLLLRD